MKRNGGGGGGGGQILLPLAMGKFQGVMVMVSALPPHLPLSTLPIPSTMPTID